MLMGVLVTTILLFDDNALYSVSEVERNGTIELSIGALTGDYEVDHFELENATKVVIPYTTTIKEGEFSLVVEDSDKVIVEKIISEADEGMIEFDAEARDYYVTVYGENVKDAELELSILVEK